MCVPRCNIAVFPFQNRREKKDGKRVLLFGGCVVKRQDLNFNLLMILKTSNHLFLEIFKSQDLNPWKTPGFSPGPLGPMLLCALTRNSWRVRWHPQVLFQDQAVLKNCLCLENE